MEYVLGTLKPLSRARFERLIDSDASLRRIVGNYEMRFAEIDAHLAPIKPPKRLWRSLAQEIKQPSDQRRLFGWRLATTVAAATAMASVAGLFLTPAPAPRVLAVLTSPNGRPTWVALTMSGGELFLEPAGAQAADPAHDYELWSLENGVPRSLGVLARSGVLKPGVPIPSVGSALAVSLEPRGGSVTGSPTGPVVSQATLPPRT